MIRGDNRIWRQHALGWLYAMALLLCALPTAHAASALQLAHNESGEPFSLNLCYAVTPMPLYLSEPPEPPPQSFHCSGTPTDYQKSSLWVEIAPETATAFAPDIFVRQTRFDALHVGYIFRDGSTYWQAVRNGDYGNHWRIGAQIAFESDGRAVPVERILLRFDRLTDHHLIHLRLMSPDGAMRQNAKIAAIIAASMMLMLIAGLYSLAIARTEARKASTYWQALWALTMLIWSALWSQTHLLLFPNLAGMLSLQLGIIISCCSIAFATFAAILAVKPAQQHRLFSNGAMALAVLIMLSATPYALIRAHRVEWADNVLAAIILLDLALIVAALCYAVRRGSKEARSMLVAWCVPMSGLGLISAIDLERHFWGSGSKLLVLMSATWYALWLTISSARRLSALSKERDKAEKLAEAAMRLAVQDPLTGLCNRRGFIDRAQMMLAKARADGQVAALLLIDVDRFKAVNDRYGHHIGDRVLCSVAAAIERWENSHCAVARIGGEEFAILVIGLSGAELQQFAEKVRQSIKEWKAVRRLVHRPVTASIGVAEAFPAVDFDTLYPVADRALYAAKHSGRDRVRIAAVEAGAWNASTAEQNLLIG